MASNTCMNSLCGDSTSIEWKKGWTLRSGECANLCDKCGSAYEQLNFCDMFHSKDSGWRECTSCGKRLHCGCIASRFLLELLDSGGVKCICCVKSSKLHPVRSDGKPNGFGTSAIDDADELQTSSADNRADAVSIEKMKLLQFHNISDGNGLKHLLQSQNGDAKRSFLEMKKEELMAHPVEIQNPCVSDANKPVTGSSRTAKPYICKSNAGVKRRYEPLTQTNLSFSLGDPSGNPNSFPGVVVDEREQSDTTAPFLQGPRSDHLFPKPPKLALTTGLETNPRIIPQVHVARPSAGARNQLLPRYWPRITEQELQQISGEYPSSNSTIVPLFEKVLSASDAGRIGRLVLPKACAEAYFPPISQPEGLPLRIQDVKGKEWVFQFRFWPNNNSRMYVLEGVTPCIQSMQLQAGDTVIFSRMDPEGKLIMGFRKASNSVNMQLLKGSTGPQINAFSKHYDSACSWITPEKNGGRTRDCLLLQTMVIPERKKTRNIGSRSKRLLIDTQEALELKLTWEEVQDMLRTPPSLTPSVVTVEDHEFEEFEEPPVFGKMSIFIVRTSGGQEQWAQCDSCFKWRKLPVHILLPPKWTCAENCWDPCRCSCSAPDELNSRELENLLILHKDFKRRRIATSNGLTQEHESLGVDALANATILEDEPGTTSVATTTKHPRHRPGCSCIVCIQPPSGKGKHKPTCTCNVCMAVKRRFKTLMTRKKKRQSEAEREVQIAQKNHYIWSPKDESMLHHDPSDDEARLANELEPTSRSNFSANKLGENSKWSIDLNFQPDRGEDLQVGLPRVSMMSLLQIASLPLETYMKQNGLTSLIPEQLASSRSHSNWNSERRLSEDRCLPSMVQEQDSSGGEDCGPEQSQTDPL